MTNTSTISGKKRDRKLKDDADPNKLQKTVEIKNDKEEVGSSTDVQKLDSKVCKGKSPVQRKEQVKSTPKNKGKEKVNEEEEDEEEEVKDLEIPEEELSKEKDEEDEDEDEPSTAAGIIDRKISRKDVKSICRLTGRPVLKDEARKRWPCRYELMEGGVDCFQHYTSAQVDGVDFELNDCCYIKAAEGETDYIGRIVEFFETEKKKPYIYVKWFFRPVDTVIGKEAHSDLVDADLMNVKLVFASNSSDVNPLDCIVSKIAVVQSSPEDVPKCDFFYNMSYSEEFYTFEKLTIGDEQDVAPTSSSISSKRSSTVVNGACDSQESVMTLLDLFSGCGGMPTGLCMGAAANNVNLVARWALDYNKDACLSLRHNHPETEVRNEKAEDFLELLKKWQELCESLFLIGTPFSKTKIPIERNETDNAEQDPKMCPPDDNGEYEVDKFIDICYGDPNETGKPKALYYKVTWKGWGSDHDSWEPADELVKCEESINDFVTQGYQSNILPLPGYVDVVCGGPPCQGMSGFNRFRNVDNPLEDEKNSQLDVFMNIVGFLRPKFTLMENVVDILKFKEGYCGRYAVGRLVAMEYQVRLGLLVAGSFGLPQYRQRAFFWGAKTTETLPQFPKPTHKVIGRGVTPKEFASNLVVGEDNKLLKALVLRDAISDLPPISTHEIRDEMDYVEGPNTEFQRNIRLSKHELMGSAPSQSMQSVSPKLYDHLPLKLSADDNHRVCMIPREKGANFRDLPGVIVDAVTKVASLDLDNRVFLDSGRPLVPDYAIKFVKGKSKKPFGRLWFDEIVNTVVTRAEPHNQAILHPLQDRVLSIRENARLQGFPDFYKLFGTVKQRYMQVGNAVAVPVGRALGFTLGNAIHKNSDGGQTIQLPPCS